MPSGKTRKLPALLCPAILSAGVLFAMATPASAFWHHGTTPRACAPLSDRFDVPGLWLGHFSGGRLAYHANGDKRVDWRNDYQCFVSARACHVWRAQMKRQYSHFTGHGTCLALRGGGRAIRHSMGGIAARY